MQISSSSRTVSDMKITLQKTIRGITAIQDQLRNTMAALPDWTDAQGMQYRDLVRQIARLTDSPRCTLEEAVPKLEAMIRALQAYENVKF